MNVVDEQTPAKFFGILWPKRIHLLYSLYFWTVVHAVYVHVLSSSLWPIPFPIHLSVELLSTVLLI